MMYTYVCIVFVVIVITRKCLGGLNLTNSAVYNIYRLMSPCVFVCLYACTYVCTLVIPRYEIIYIAIITISHHDNHDILNELNILIRMVTGCTHVYLIIWFNNFTKSILLYNTSRCSQNMYRLRFYVCITK